MIPADVDRPRASAAGVEAGGGPGRVGSVTVGEVCTPRFLAAPRRRRVTEVARFMGGRWVSCVIVTEGGRPTGIVTRRGLVEDVLARGYTGLEVTVGDIMHSPIVTIDAGADLREAAKLMARRSIRHVAVTQGGRVVGVLSDYHVARLLPRLIAGETVDDGPAGEAAGDGV